jgi:demethylmenaquinone methyltransferase / 2-methoxy-6-polyprenyl-1,4-benzoquinol methylase
MPLPTEIHSSQPEKIKNMFGKVAGKYDLANSVLSLGIHHLWRKKLVALSQAEPGQKVLDCATGTGDLAIEFKKQVGTLGEVTGTDFCIEMLGPAPKKAKSQDLEIHFQVADVMDLPFEKNSFDICSISFGIRNVQDPKKALSEMARVTRPGGQVMILEFGQMQWPVISTLYNFYSEKILPYLGALVTGEKEAYEYLHKSAQNFPCREGFLEVMESTNAFSEVKYTSLSGGIAYIYQGAVKTT